MKKLLVLLALLAASPAFAQWQVPSGSVPVGRGDPVVGFNSIAPGSNGNCLQVVGGVWTSAACPGGGGPGGVSGNVQTNNGSGGFAGLTDAQLTAKVGVATNLLSGAVPAWPNNTTSFFRADGTYAQPTIGGIAGQGTGVATFLGTPSSANLRAALTDESGTGAAYFQGGDIGTPSAGVGTNLTALNASNLGSGTVPFARLPVPAKAGSSGGSPGVGTTTSGMAGLAFTITPATSGNLLIEVAINMGNNTGTNGCTATLAFGTGAAPTHNAAVTGTAFGATQGFNGFGGGTQSLTIPVNAYRTGFTVSTTYWIDVQYGVNGTGTCLINAYSITAVEL